MTTAAGRLFLSCFNVVAEMFMRVHSEEQRHPEEQLNHEGGEGGSEGRSEGRSEGSHLGLDDPVHDGFHGFRLVTLHYSFEVLRAVLEGLRDGDVQVVVGLLSSQVLQRWWTVLVNNTPRVCVFSHKHVTYNHVKLGVNIHNFSCNERNGSSESRTRCVLRDRDRALAVLPESSTTGSADTRLSTKMLSALMMGVSGRMKAMWRYVPTASSLSVCFMNAGFPISHIWKQHKHTSGQGCVFTATLQTRHFWLWPLGGAEICLDQSVDFQRLPQTH